MTEDRHAEPRHSVVNQIIHNIEVSLIRHRMMNPMLLLLEIPKIKLSWSRRLVLLLIEDVVQIIRRNKIGRAHV